jgi:hypothetical protein
MANAPIAKSMVVPEGEIPESSPGAWYSKWLWIGAAGGGDYFPDRPHLDVRLTAGVDFFSFMGLDTGLGYQANFPLSINAANDRYWYRHKTEQSLILPIKLKFLIKTESLLVEPNGGIQFQLRFPGSYAEELDHRTREDSLILLPAILWGLDFRAELGPGALGFGPRMIYDLESRGFGFGFSMGYQFGLFPKKPKAPKPVQVESTESLEETDAQEEALVETAMPETGLEEAGAPEEEPEENSLESPADF